MVEYSRSQNQADLAKENLAGMHSIKESLRAACQQLAVGNLEGALSNFSKSELSLKDLRAQSNIMDAAKEGTLISRNSGDKDTASRIFTIFGLSSRDFPELYRQGAFLHSPVVSPASGIAYSAVEMRDEILTHLSDASSFKSDKHDGCVFHTKSFFHPKLDIKGEIEVYTNPRYIEKVINAGLEVPQVMAIIRPPGLSTGYYMRVQIIAEEFPVQKGMNALSGELTDTLYHELCHQGQETYRQQNPKENLPEIKYGHLDSKPGFATSFAYFVECPDELSAFVRESGFRSIRQGISIGQGLRRTIDQQISLADTEAHFSTTERSILRTCMEEMYQRAAADIWPSKVIVIPG
jgi:hypothetical protein